MLIWFERMLGYINLPLYFTAELTLAAVGWFMVLQVAGKLAIFVAVTDQSRTFQRRAKLAGIFLGCWMLATAFTVILIFPLLFDFWFGLVVVIVAVPMPALLLWWGTRRAVRYFDTLSSGLRELDPGLMPNPEILRGLALRCVWGEFRAYAVVAVGFFGFLYAFYLQFAYLDPTTSGTADVGVTVGGIAAVCGGLMIAWLLQRVDPIWSFIRAASMMLSGNHPLGPLVPHPPGGAYALSSIPDFTLPPNFDTFRRMHRSRNFSMYWYWIVIHSTRKFPAQIRESTIEAARKLESDLVAASMKGESVAPHMRSALGFLLGDDINEMLTRYPAENGVRRRSGIAALVVHLGWFGQVLAIVVAALELLGLLWQ